MPLRTERFSRLPDGTDVDLYVLDNGRVELSAIAYSGVITALVVPDRHGQRASVVLGHDHLEPYLENRPYVGALIGRYANRIAGAQFRLDVLRRHAGFCLEPHPFPDSPNRPELPSTELRPGQTYRSRTVWRLGWR